MDSNNQMRRACELANALIACPSVTPATGQVFDVLESMLAPLDFSVHRFIEGEAPDGPVENLFAIRGTSGKHFAYAGHVDVVPPGEGWNGDPFKPEIRNGLLYGRGAVDMKGSVAAFIAALENIDTEEGIISLIITGDEEGPATYGTKSIMRFMADQGIIPDFCLVGEPTSVHKLGDMIKIGRRGSVNMWITVEGMQGHVAYPHLADNPITKLIAIMHEIDAVTLDEGTDWFQPSNIEFTDLTVGNPAHNVIPARAQGRLSIRFNDTHCGEELVSIINAIAEKHGGSVEARISGEPFLTKPGVFSDIIAHAIHDITGLDTELSTSGGTSDARFLSAICPVVEFGLRNATMHKLDEAVEVNDLERLSLIYVQIAKAVLAG